MLSMDKDELTRKMERDAEAAAKRQQNALPTWHMKSTITGDLTALGVKENARIGGNAAEGSVITPNDEMLRGLGTVGLSRMESVVEIVEEEVKPVVNQEPDCMIASLRRLLT